MTGLFSSMVKFGVGEFLTHAMKSWTEAVGSNSMPTLAAMSSTIDEIIDKLRYYMPGTAWRVAPMTANTKNSVT